ncbi:organic hydroperoxide resistance protein [Chryseobacterium geocarposphaerae]|uniref:Ohr subfamily peroxiredoxin n=1 Tax=Chryseobacterium geocarposphaerae TaxID=1416776 RepID=A0A2M9C6F3_9FLAO|nr:organic hydroperoxide resistance protein [Chryseobacterium geocarposphaerae]PJJ66427.1 Ohr subfamily peroxiredoxin [Chryseobacterium geocarposphaerae]
MKTITKIDKVLYTAKTHTVGGREGSAKSSDEKLDILLTPPGLNGKGTNPEQLFAAGWSACYIGALGLAAKKLGIVLPKDTYVDAEIDLGLNGEAYSLQARLFVSVPGIKNEIAEQLIELAHQTCPYSKAVKGNISISTTII